MDERDPGKMEAPEAAPVTMILERRKEGRTELSSTEVMRILRKRAAKAARKGIEIDITDSTAADK